jgi:beta-phosphoglucomutase-like phosphatase (HAD superfamily)
VAAETGDIEAVLFDIDGTLITTGGAGGVAWSRAFEEIYGEPVDITKVTESGMVDTEVGSTALRSVLGREPEGRELAKVTQQYLRHLPESVADSDGYVVMPGVRELLERLIGEGILLGLTTGNVEAAAHIKLERGHLNRFFSFGGYGSDAPDRPGLTRAAIDRAGLVSGGVVKPDDCVAVGDTPRDVSAAHAAGIRVVSVATGNFSLDELKAAEPDWAIETVESGFPL